MAIMGCICNVVVAEAFDKAIANNSEEIQNAPTLLDAVGIVYREARDTESRLLPETVIPSCTNCFNWVGQVIQAKTGLFAGEILPRKTFEADCPRRAQCFAPAQANSNVMDNGAVAPCLSGPAVATL